MWISGPRHRPIRLTTNVLLWRERIPGITLVRVDQVTVVIQKKKEGGTGLWRGQEVVNTLLDLEEEMGLLKKNAISGGWADIKYLEINGRLNCYLSEINFVHKHILYIVQFSCTERTSAEKCVRCITLESVSDRWEERAAAAGSPEIPRRCGLARLCCCGTNSQCL